jgi:hypothetical protein
MYIKREEKTYSEFSLAESGLYIVHKIDQSIRLPLKNVDIKELSEMSYN